MPNTSIQFRTGLHWLTVATLLVSSSGASCNRGWMNPFGATGPAAPILLADGAQVDQIAAAINQNTSRVSSLGAPYASIAIPDLVLSLRGNIALERPNRFRLTAGTAITGQEVDLGSNEQRFWLWVRQNQPPAVYLCRHDQFAGSAAHQIMPIEPRWLHSALGLVQLDPSSVYEGPTPRKDGTLELRSYLASSAGTLHRVLVIDAAHAWVREQHVYDASGTTLIASAVAQSHQYYPTEQVSLPQRVTIRLPTSQFAFTITLGQVQINQPSGNSAQLWTMPQFQGIQQIDLGTLPDTAPLPLGPMTPSGQMTGSFVGHVPAQAVTWSTHPWPRTDLIAERPKDVAPSEWLPWNDVQSRPLPSSIRPTSYLKTVP